MFGNFVRQLSFLCIVISLSALQIATAQNPGSLRLNEIMSSNSATIADEDGDFEDWVELYNAGTTAINLEGYGLSDNYSQPFKWVLPDVQIGPGEFLIIWASGKNRIDPASPLHTNYGISAAGEEVLLTHPDGTRLDSLPPVRIPTDVSIGRKPDGTSDWYFFNEPTPGASNTTVGYTELLSPPVFSHHSGFYSTPIQLSLHHDDPQVQIIYTLDGSNPSVEALSGISFRYKTGYNRRPDEEPGVIVTDTIRSFVFNQALAIEDRSNEPNRFSLIPTTWDAEPSYLPVNPISKGTVVRALAYKPGAMPSEIITGSYFITDQSELTHLPIVSLVTDPRGLFDYDDGVYVPGVDFDQWRQENPDQTASATTPANYHRRGDESERTGFFSFFEPGNPSVAFEQETGMRIHGFTARRNPIKSLRLYARGRYGDSEFNYPFFTGVSGERHRRLILRNSGQDYDYTYLRDALAQQLVGHMRFDTQAYRPMIVFINGEYWGIHNLRERLDNHYLGIQYGVDSDNLDINETNFVTVEGDVVHYFNTIQYILENDLAIDEHYDYITTRLDPQNFMDYQIAQMFVQNHDWPGSNIQYWRLRTDQYEPNRAYGHDGRWRWLMYDLDRSMTLYSADPAWNENTLFYATADDSEDWRNPPWSTLVLRNMLRNERFRNEFINRYTDQLNTAFSAGRFTSLLNEFSDGIRPEIPNHSERWRGTIRSVSSWDRQLDRLHEYAENRATATFGHLQEFFNLGETYTLSISTGNESYGIVKLNSMYLTEETPGVVLADNTWSGRYFADVPVVLSASAREGFTFSHWMIDGERRDESKLSLSLSADTQILVHFVESDEPPIADRSLIHYFLFRNIANDTPLEAITAVYPEVPKARIWYESSLDGYPFDQNHPSWRQASMERRNQPTPINYRPEGNNGQAYADIGSIRALQVRQPFVSGNRENILMIHLPTSGYESTVLSFAAMDENAGVRGLMVDYAASFEVAGVDTIFMWTTAGMSPQNTYLGLTTGVYQLYTVDFSEIDDVNNNPDFRVRIRFDAQDGTLANGDRVTFNNIALDGSAISVSVPPLASDLPDAFLLGQNYPNPFNPTTTIPFALTESAHVNLEVYNTIGQRVAVLRNEVMPAGRHQVRFDATGLSSGVYVYRLESAGMVYTRKLLLIR